VQPFPQGLLARQPNEIADRFLVPSDVEQDVVASLDRFPSQLREDACASTGEARRSGSSTDCPSSEHRAPEAPVVRPASTTLKGRGKAGMTVLSPTR
jgi:hypothetical protein